MTKKIGAKTGPGHRRNITIISFSRDSMDDPSEQLRRNAKCQNCWKRTEPAHLAWQCPFPEVSPETRLERLIDRHPKLAKVWAEEYLEMKQPRQNALGQQGRRPQGKSEQCLRDERVDPLEEGEIRRQFEKKLDASLTNDQRKTQYERQMGAMWSGESNEERAYDMVESMSVADERVADVARVEENPTWSEEARQANKQFALIDGVPPCIHSKRQLVRAKLGGRALFGRDARAPAMKNSDTGIDSYCFIRLNFTLTRMIWIYSTFCIPTPCILRPNPRDTRITLRHHPRDRY